MTANTSLIWTDVDLIPEARRLLAENRATLDVHLEGTSDGIENADALIVGSLLAGNASLFERATRLKAVARCGIGYDRVDVPAATAAGVCALNTPDAPTESTAEFAMTLMLGVARRLTLAAGQLAVGKWGQGNPLVGFDLEGKTLGLVGCGRIGRRVAELASAFRMEIQAFDPPAATLPTGVRRAPTLFSLLGSSDVISLHVPLSAETRHLIGPAELAGCKPGAILINTARGPLVDESALLDALRGGQLSGAGIDVWDPEPPAEENPLLRLPTVVATPHIAALTREGRRRSHLAAASQVIQVLRGERPAFLLNPEVWALRRGHGR